MRRLLRISLVAALGIAASLAGAQVTQQGSRYLFRLHLTTGEKISFRIPFSFSGVADKPLYFHFGMKLNVKRVTAAGKATIHCTLQTGGLALPGIDPKGGSFDVDQRGRVADEGSAPIGFCVLYPKDPVAVGESFVAPVPSALGGNLGGGTAGAQATFKFVGFADVRGHRVARLTFHVSGNKDPGGSILIRVSDGVIEKYFTSFTVTLAQVGKPMPVSATIIRI